jgi:hypothetical protein
MLKFLPGWAIGILIPGFIYLLMLLAFKRDVILSPMYPKGDDASQSSSDIQCGSDTPIQCAATP